MASGENTGRAGRERPVSPVAGEGRHGDRGQRGGGGGARPRDTRAEELRRGGLRVLVLLPLSWPTLLLALSAGLPFPGLGPPRLPPRTPEGSSCSGERSGQQLSQDNCSPGPWMH